MIMGRQGSHTPRGDKKFEINPMHQSIGTRLDNLRRAPRCGATTRVGAPCQCPAMRGRKRCRLHGGISPGAPRGNQCLNRDSDSVNLGSNPGPPAR
ncbi:MAG: hypothetical protein CR217_07655 [Beijerinckiaceae bacterium]|nr:MAG: hypothetical protein CR217_07655 [Beijerinckiaceae bacterium]